MATLWKSKRALDLMNPSTGLPSFGTLVCCYDFTEQITQDSAPILRHPDLVGNWPLFGERTSRPIYKNNVLNGRTVARFDGVDDVLQTAANFGTGAGLSGNAAFSVFVVARKTTVTKGAVYGWGQTSGSLGAAGIYDDNTTASIAFAGSNNFTSTLVPNNTWHLHSATKAPGAINSTTTIRRNGASVASGTPSTNTPNINGSQTLALGRWANFTGVYLEGDIAFFAMFSGVVSNVAAVESYINTYVGGVY